LYASRVEWGRGIRTFAVGKVAQDPVITATTTVTTAMMPVTGERT
jgi:hypothetical protein